MVNEFDLHNDNAVPDHADTNYCYTNSFTELNCMNVFKEYKALLKYSLSMGDRL